MSSEGGFEASRASVPGGISGFFRCRRHHLFLRVGCEQVEQVRRCARVAGGSSPNPRVCVSGSRFDQVRRCARVADSRGAHRAVRVVGGLFDQVRRTVEAARNGTAYAPVVVDCEAAQVVARSGGAGHDGVADVGKFDCSPLRCGPPPTRLGVPPAIAAARQVLALLPPGGLLLAPPRFPSSSVCSHAREDNATSDIDESCGDSTALPDEVYAHHSRTVAAGPLPSLRSGHRDCG